MAMVVTIHDPAVDPAQTAAILETVDQTPAGHWQGVERQVDNVYADQAFRGGRIEGVSAPVAVGRFLIDSGRLTLHSETRSESGDRWAQAVGGKIPELLELPTGDFERHMRDWLAELNSEVVTPDLT